jgi:hypothetical protein
MPAFAIHFPTDVESHFRFQLRDHTVPHARRVVPKAWCRHDLCGAARFVMCACTLCRADCRYCSELCPPIVSKYSSAEKVSVIKRNGPKPHSGRSLAGMTNRFGALIALVGTLLCGAVPSFRIERDISGVRRPDPRRTLFQRTFLKRALAGGQPSRSSCVRLSGSRMGSLGGRRGSSSAASPTRATAGRKVGRDQFFLEGMSWRENGMEFLGKS